MPLILRHSDIRIQADKVWLDAVLSFAPDVRGLIVCVVPFAYRPRDSREHHATAQLRASGYATLAVSMLTPYEETRNPDVLYDIPLLSTRLAAIVTWIDQQPDLTGLPLGLLTSSTLTAAAIRYLNRSASQDGERISALVSRAGRVDLAGADPLRRLQTPTLLLAPGVDEVYAKSAGQAYALLTCAKSWQAIKGADSPFSDADKLDAATRAAGAWFIRHLPAPTPKTDPATAETAPPEPGSTSSPAPPEGPIRA